MRRFLKYELDNYLRSAADRGGRGSCRSSASRTSTTSTTARARWSCTCCRSGSARTRSTARSARFLANYAFKGAPYPRSLDLIDEFRKEAKTPEQQQLITDLFERITLYDLKVTDAPTKQATRRLDDDADGRGRQILCRRQGRGDEGDARRADRDRPVHREARPRRFSSKDVIVMEREPIHSGTQSFVVHSKAKPTFAGIDPYNFYIDRNSDDNVKDVTAG